jgi:hypothetical protein
VDIASGALTPLDAFSYGIGGAVPGSVGPVAATDRDTNMQGNGAIMPENEELLLFSIMVEFFQLVVTPADFFNGDEAGTPTPPEVSARNVGRIQRDTLLELRIADTKNYVKHPLGFFPASMGLCTTTAATVAGDGVAGSGGPILGGQNGGPNVYDARQLATPHHVGPGEALRVQLQFPVGQVTGLAFGADTSARVLTRIYLDGYRRRPVA